MLEHIYLCIGYCWMISLILNAGISSIPVFRLSKVFAYISQQMYSSVLQIDFSF